MSKDKKRRKSRSCGSDFDGVTVKRSWYSFSEYYPGGGSSQIYRKVMKQTKDEKRTIKIIFAGFGLFVAFFTGFFSMSVAMDISNAPTTVPSEVTESVTDPAPQESTETPSQIEPQTGTTGYDVTLEEPEREVNVTEPLIE